MQIGVWCVVVVCVSV